MPATLPRPEQLENLIARKPEGALYMLNLLKFKQQAEYEDGRETDLTGEQAYGLYGAGVTQIIHEMGGRMIWGGKANALLIGDGDLEWDAVALVQYPSFEHFSMMTQSPAYQALHVHRDAGLAHQLLVHCLGPEQLGSAFATTAATLGATEHKSNAEA